MSKVGFWLKGSTGKLAGTTLYKGANGETIQREIVSPSNPKTMAQNIQRIVMSTVGAAYSVMKAICDNSLAASGYSFVIAPYSDGNGTGGDPGDVN